MKAAICYEFGQPLKVEEVDLVSPKHGEVKLRIAATAVCHSDIHAIKGEFGGEVPLVPGHESSGYVEEIGEGVTRVKSGDACVVSLIRSCGRCPNCTTGLTHLCTTSFPMDKEIRMYDKQGKALRRSPVTMGSFAEYVVVDQSQVVPIPKEMPMDCAALLACGVITGFGAVVNRAKVEPLKSVVVVGAGGIGLNSVQGAAISGAYPIIAVDLFDYKLKAAQTFGATHILKADDEVVKKVQDLTFGRGADYVFVTAGSISAIQQGFAMSGPRGMTVVIGLVPITENLTLPPFFIGEKMLTSSRMGSTRLSVDIPRLVALYQAGRLKLDELITDRYPLDQINEAIEGMERGEALRNVIVF